MEVGYIGLGSMGGALARRLLVSRGLRVFDLKQELVAQFKGAGATPATSAAELARNCDVIILCLPRSANVRAAIFGKDGLAEGLAPGKIVVDQTSGDPSETRRIAAELADRGVHMIDAPVSGGPKGAEAGTIAIMVGGGESVYAAVTPILEQISPNHTYCGPVGAGQVIKLINNTVSTCNRIALLEGVAVGLKNGISMDTMVTVLNAGGARSRTSENLLPLLARGAPVTKFALALMLKDVNLAAQLAMESGAPLQFGQLARGVLQSASNLFGPDANLDDRLAEFVGSQAGVSIGPAGD